MASPASNDAEMAAEDSLKSILVSSQSSSESVSDGNQDSVPPSPEFGMARENTGRPSDADTEDETEEDISDLRLPGTPLNSIGNPNDEAAFTTNIENRSIAHPLPQRTQQSPPVSAQKASVEITDSQLLKPAPIYPATRRSSRAKSTLVYDQKYHPMDDIIRPSQAAKRRSLHGEKALPPDDSDGSDASSSNRTSSDVGSMVGDEESDDDEPQPSKQRQKRKRPESRTPEPTRRSSRRRVSPKISYNMKIHPQDSDLRRVYACDGSRSSPLPKKQEGTSLSSFSSNSGSAECFPEPHKKPSDIHPDLSPDIAYLTRGHACGPHVNGQPFHIFTESMENQLNAEAEAASPLHYDADDKENDVTNPELVPTPSPLDSISIIPASHYRQSHRLYNTTGSGSMASNAFYAHPQFEAVPYGLGWSDGAHDRNSRDFNDCPDYLRILASGEDLPRSPLQDEARSHERRSVSSSSPTRDIGALTLLR